MSENNAKLVDQTIFINAPCDAVYGLISDPQELSNWLIDQTSGAEGDNPGSREGEMPLVSIVESVPYERVRLAWESHGRIPKSIVEIRLTSQSSGTLVHLQQSVSADESPMALRPCRVSAVVAFLETTFNAPLSVPSAVERAASDLLFLAPRAGEHSIAYAGRRVVGSLSIAAVVGAVAIANLLFVHRGSTSWPAAAGYTAIALALMLGNVFFQTLIGLAIQNAGRTLKSGLLAVSGFMALVSCYAFFWVAGGDLEANSERASNWLAVGLATPLFVALYSLLFEAEVARRGLFQPKDWNHGRRLSLTVVLTLCFVSTAQADDSLSAVAEQIDKLASRKYASDEPGAALLVAKGGQVIHSRGYGLANLKPSTLITPDTAFCIASVTKPITAAAALRLVEQGKLKLDDQIVDILPDYPRQAAGVTIAHLLSHMAGIPDVSRLPEWRADMRTDLTVPQILKYFESLPLSAAPGEKWRYSNSGYLLLGAAMERVSGKSFGELLQEEVFGPAGMRDTYYGGAVSNAPERAEGYQRSEGAYVPAEVVSLTRPYAAGGIVSTANDLYAFSRALTNDKIISADMRRAAFTPQKLNSGEPTTYGLGWMVGSFHGIHAVQHSGGMPGYTAQMWLLPDEEVFAVLLSNAPDKTDQKLIANIVALTLGKVDKQKTVRLDAQLLQKYAGRYQLTGFGDDIVTVGYADGKLTMHVPPNPICELHATAPNEFFVTEEDIQLTFEVDSAGQVQSVVLHHGGLDLRASRLDD